MIGAGDCHVKTRLRLITSLTFALFVHLSCSCCRHQCSFLKQLDAYCCSCFSQVLLQALGYCSRTTYHYRDYSSFYFSKPLQFLCQILVFVYFLLLFSSILVSPDTEMYIKSTILLLHDYNVWPSVFNHVVCLDIYIALDFHFYCYYYYYYSFYEPQPCLCASVARSLMLYTSMQPGTCSRGTPT